MHSAVYIYPLRISSGPVEVAMSDNGYACDHTGSSLVLVLALRVHQPGEKSKKYLWQFYTQSREKCPRNASERRILVQESYILT